MSNKQLPALSMKAGGALEPIYPHSLDEVAKFARMAIMSGLLKPQRVRLEDGNYGNEDGDAVLARGTMAILQGMEVGLPPMQALQLIAVINGRCSVHSEGVPAILWKHGFKIKERFEGNEEGWPDDFAAVCELTRPNGEVIIGRFSVKDAKQAKLWDQNAKTKKTGKNGAYETDNDSAWFKYPKRMLKARALGFAAKDGGSDALRGLAMAEEQRDIELSREDYREVTPARDARPALETPPDIPDEAPDLLADSAGFLAALDDRLAEASDQATLDEIWQENLEIVESRLSRTDREIAAGHLAKHADRLALKAAIETGAKA